MTTKLSLVMSGAVSLGSYHAGVMTELLHALDWHNRQEPGKYQLDVISGASAGSLTGALVGNIVMNDFARRDNLRRAWVDLVTIDRLLTAPPSNAFLSHAPVQQIGRECIREPFTTAGKASFAPPVLYMVFTLSNLNGLNRRLASTQGSFVSTFFDDRKVFHVGQPEAVGPGVLSVESAETWDHIRTCAIVSGAFPLAFQPVRLSRQHAEFTLLDAAWWDGGAPREFTYVDGGTFNNQPIAEAVALSRKADADRPHQPRKYIFVNASPDNSSHDPDIGHEITDTAPSLLEISWRLIGAIFNQSRTSDWIRSQLINDQIRWRDGLFAELVEIVRLTDVPDPAPLVGGLTRLAESIFHDRQDRAGSRAPSPSFDDALARTRQKYDSFLDAADHPVRREILTLIFLILDHVSDLDERKKIDITTINPPGTLAGQQLQAFGGFFHPEWREYNYRRGRIEAAPVLAEVLGPYPREEAAVEEYAIPAAWQAFPEQTLADTPRQPRERFRDMLVQRARDQAWSLRPTGWYLADWYLVRQVGSYAYRQLTDLLKL